ASINYANDNKSWLPPFRNNAGETTLQNLDAYLYTMDYGGSPDPGALTRRLILTKYLRSASSPSTYGAVQYRIEACPSALDVGDPGRANYYYNPHLAHYGTNWQPWWKKINGFGKPPH